MGADRTAPSGLPHLRRVLTLSRRSEPCYDLHFMSGRNHAPAGSLLALRREAGGAHRRGTCGARSRSARDAVRPARPAVFDHPRIWPPFEGADYDRALEEMARASAEYREIGEGAESPAPRAVLPERRAAAARPVRGGRPVPGTRGADRRSARSRTRGSCGCRWSGSRCCPDAMPPPKSDFERELQMLEVELRRLEAEYNMFFAGRLPRLPWETARARRRAGEEVRSHRSSRTPPIASASRPCRSR